MNFDTRTVIAHFDHNGGCTRIDPARNPYEPLWIAVAPPVFNKVADRADNFVGFALKPNLRVRQGDLDANTRRIGQNSQGGASRGDHVLQDNVAVCAASCVAFNARERQQIGHQALHALDFAGHDRKKMGNRVGVALTGFKNAGNRGQRRFQLVAKVCHKILTHLNRHSCFIRVLQANQNSLRAKHRTGHAVCCLGPPFDRHFYRFH